MNNKIIYILTLLISLIINYQAVQAEDNQLLTYKNTGTSPKQEIIFDFESDSSIDKLKDNDLYVISNNKFVSTRTPNKDNLLIDHTNQKVTPEVKLFKGEIKKNEELYDVITLENESITESPLEQLNLMLETSSPCSSIKPLIFQEKETSPFINRLKTVYFLTSLSTYIGQSTQIEDAFTKGAKLTGGGVSKGDQYGYNNVFRNIMSPFQRCVKGAEADDSGPIVNYIQHPFFGFGISSYLTASGASAKEVFLVSLLDNFMFEFVAEGTYVAPSGIDFLTTSGGIVAGYFASKYIFKKPFQAFLKKTSYLKDKYNVEFDPIVAPGDTGKGVKIGSQITFKH
ncbi:MAG: DUF3943 domain-containing protein [Vampirovibrionia bacterium]